MFKVDLEEIYSLFLEGNVKFYKIIEIFKCLVDDFKLIYYKNGYGKIIICVYVCIDGWLVGIVVNNWEVVKNKKGEM